MTYSILFIVSFILMTILGITSGLLDKVLGIGSLIGGILTAIVTFYLIRYLYQEVYPETMLTEGGKIAILIPVLLNGLRALYVANIQTKTRDMTWGEINIQMKVNKQIPTGLIVGAIISYFF